MGEFVVVADDVGVLGLVAVFGLVAVLGLVGASDAFNVVGPRPVDI